MKIAAVSDIHGKLLALDAVLKDIRAQGADALVNLGDVVSGPLQPKEPAARLIALRAPAIRGNHERQVLPGDPSLMGPSDRFAFERLLDAQRLWIKQLPATLWSRNGCEKILLIAAHRAVNQQHII